jgi:SAM-dependent methyltransferase
VQEIPLPPLELANRVGCLDSAADPLQWYQDLGAQIRDGILAAAPSGWALDGKRVLDFGCGAGRTLRHFLTYADKAEFWGCDIDEPSIAWIRQHLSPPLHVFSNAPAPPLGVADGSFDLVYAVSVFTHLADSWAEWLVELHRVLVPDGLLLVTFIGEGAIAWVTDEPWVDERIGMHVISYAQSWDLGGPMVVHSPWWIRAHFQRAFEIVDLRPTGFGSLPHEGQGSVLMRKRAQTCTVEALRRPEPDEPREAIALEHNRRRLFAEIAALHAQQEKLAGELDDARERVRQAEAATLSSEQRLSVIASSRSWRLTAPVRRLADRVRRTRRPR